MKYVLALSEVLARLMYYVAGVALTTIMLLTVLDVILRSFKTPILGTYELVGLLGAIVVGFAIPQTSKLDGHVIMDMIPTALSGLSRRLMRILTRLLGISIFLVIALNLWSMGTDFKMSGEVTPTLQLPLYPIAWGISVCCYIQCLILFVDILNTWKPEA